MQKRKYTQCDPRRPRHSDEALCSLASGSLTPWRALRLRRHLAACTKCQARFDETQRLWSGLRELAAAPAPEETQEALEHVLLQDDRAGASARALLLRRQAMKKRLVAIGGAAAALATVVALADKAETPTDVGFIRQVHGPTWRYASYYNGVVDLYDSHGQWLGLYNAAARDARLLSASAPLGPARLVLDVAGTHAVVTGPGRHEVRDSSGRLLGSVVFRPYSIAQLRRIQQDKSPTPHDFPSADAWLRNKLLANCTLGGLQIRSGVVTLPGYVMLSVPKVDTSCVVRGNVKVTATLAGERKPEASGQTQPVPAALERALPPSEQFTPAELAVPQVAITTAGATRYETGYGNRTVAAADGKPLLNLTVLPLDQAGSEPQATTSAPWLPYRIVIGANALQTATALPHQIYYDPKDRGVSRAVTIAPGQVYYYVDPANGEPRTVTVPSDGLIRVLPPAKPGSHAEMLPPAKPGSARLMPIASAAKPDDAR